MYTNLQATLKAKCPVCKNETKLYWEPQYRGLGGRCNKCGAKWPES